MMVMMMAMTPSLKASNRFLPNGSFSSLGVDCVTRLRPTAAYDASRLSAFCMHTADEGHRVRNSAVC